METLYQKLEQDPRYTEGLKACFNCGTCTAVCPAAAVSDYDPRMIIDLVQQKDEAALEQLLRSDTIWMCGECLSCKTRCPRGNTPCYIIQALRALSIEGGFFTDSGQGRKQLALKRTIGEHLLEYGYCIYIDEISLDMYPEQGPVWQWFLDHRSAILERLGASYKMDRAGALRNIDEVTMNELRQIFEESGAMKRFEKIEAASEEYARKTGSRFGEGKDEYFNRLYHGNEAGKNDE